MAKHNLNDLMALVTVIREGSFVRAIGNRFDEIEAELGALTALNDKPAGTARITCADQVLRATLWPKLAPVLAAYPDIKVEFDVSYGLRDIVADRFDAGARLGEQVHQDMIAVPTGPKVRMAAAASPANFARHPPPKTPGELVQHRCINQRQGSGGLYAWEFEKRGRALEVRVEGQAIFNTSPPIVAAALDGMGIAFLPEDEFAPQLTEGRLIRVLEDWCPPFPGFHLYYPSRRHPSPAFSLVLEALRFRAHG